MLLNMFQHPGLQLNLIYNLELICILSAITFSYEDALFIVFIVETQGVETLLQRLSQAYMWLGCCDTIIQTGFKQVQFSPVI